MWWRPHLFLLFHTQTLSEILEHLEQQKDFKDQPTLLKLKAFSSHNVAHLELLQVNDFKKTLMVLPTLHELKTFKHKQDF